MALERTEYSDTWRGCRLHTGLYESEGCEVALERAESSDTWLKWKVEIDRWMERLI